MSRYVFENDSIYEAREAMGNAMEDYRSRQGMTQVELAGRLGCPQPRISAMLSRPRGVSLETWVTYFETLGMEVSFDVKSPRK